jgi:hypothetical protein
MTICGVEAEPVPVRAARSVHLTYPAPESSVFYNEVIVDQSAAGSYFMVCGWNGGYFGIQELADHRKVILFSVWDSSASKGDDPAAVNAGERVECFYQAADMRIKRFGGEGTGGQCMGDFEWSVGETNRFVMTAKPEGEKTAYSGYVWLAAEKKWKQLVTFRTRGGGKAANGLYSFIEDFRRDGKSADEVRRARFGHGWVKSAAGEWAPLLEARFTASNADWEAKETINAGTEGDWYFLATGGSTKTTTPLSTLIRSGAAPGKPPLLDGIIE